MKLKNSINNTNYLATYWQMMRIFHSAILISNDFNTFEQFLYGANIVCIPDKLQPWFALIYKQMKYIFEIRKLFGSIQAFTLLFVFPACFYNLLTLKFTSFSFFYLFGREERRWSIFFLIQYLCKNQKWKIDFYVKWTNIFNCWTHRNCYKKIILIKKHPQPIQNYYHGSSTKILIHLFFLQTMSILFARCWC